MWNSYQDYCKDMKRLKTPPLSEEIWRREYAPKDDPYREPLIISPKNRTRPMSATLENHIADVGKKVKKNDQSGLLSVLENRLKEKKKKLPKPKAVKPIKIKTLKVPKPPKVSKPKVNLKAMTPEQRRLHTNALYSIRIKKKRELEGKEGRFLMSNLSAEEQVEHKKMKRKQHREASKAKHQGKVMTPEEIQHKRDIANAWYAKNKEKRRLKRNEYIATNPDARAKRNEAVRKWEEKNREHRREYAKSWAQSKRTQLKEAILCA